MKALIRFLFPRLVVLLVAAGLLMFQATFTAVVLGSWFPEFRDCLNPSPFMYVREDVLLVIYLSQLALLVPLAVALMFVPISQRADWGAAGARHCMWCTAAFFFAGVFVCVLLSNIRYFLYFDHGQSVVGVMCLFSSLGVASFLRNYRFFIKGGDSRQLEDTPSWPSSNMRYLIVIAVAVILSICLAVSDHYLRKNCTRPWGMWFSSQ